VKVIGETGRVAFGPGIDGSPLIDVLTITARNTGLAAAQVTNVFYVVEGGIPAVLVAPEGPRLPAQVAGQHSETWVFPLSNVLAKAGSLDRVKVGLTLGDGSEKRSPITTAEGSSESG
jgi:hypothetical protein